MKTSFSSLLSFLLLASASVSVSGLKFPIHKRSASASATNGSTASVVAQPNANVGNLDNIHFTTAIQLNGINVTVIIDTGSSDLWLMPGCDIGEVEETDIEELQIDYGHGSVTGLVAIASFTFGSYNVSRQAFLQVQDTTITSLGDKGVQGLFGLGLSATNSSEIQDAVYDEYGPDADWGAPVLKQIFDSQPESRNIISIYLDRTDDMESAQEGTILIGEYDDDYPEVADMPRLYQYPEYSDRWTILLENITIGDEMINLTSIIPGTPSGKVIALIDSGAPTVYMPTSMVKTIYSKIPGASYYENGNVWIVPCNASIIIEFTFGGQSYAVHPLDITTIVSPVYANGHNYTACTGTFIGDDNAGGTELDLILGVPFMLNTVTVFDYGDADGNNTSPFIQMISITEKTEAIAEFDEIRLYNLAGLAKELDPSALITLLDGTTGTTPGDDDDEDDDDDPEVIAENPDGTPADDGEDDRVDEEDDEDDDDEDDDDDLEVTEENPDGTPIDDEDDLADDDRLDEDDEDDDDEFGDDDDDDDDDDDGDDGDEPEVTEENPDGTPFTGGNQGSRINTNLSDDSGSSTSTSDKYGPAILGLLAANLLVGLGLMILAIVTFVRRGAKAGTPRAKGAYAPIGANDEATPGYGAYQKPYDPTP